MIYVSNRYDADDLDCWADDILMQMASCGLL